MLALSSIKVLGIMRLGRVVVLVLGRSAGALGRVMLLRRMVIKVMGLAPEWVEGWGLGM